MNPAQYFDELDLWDIEKLRIHAEEKLVWIKTSERFPNLLLLHYKDEAQYSKNWNVFNRFCRGLIVDIKNKTILAHGFNKFYNLGEVPETDYNELLSLGRFQTSEKLDGSCILLFKDSNTDRLTFTTKGCFRYCTWLPVWGGGSVQIGDIVSKNLSPILIGKDKEGNLVPTQIIKKFNNGPKYDWLDIYFNPTWERKPGSHNGKLRVTPNHKIFTSRGELSAFDIKVGDNLISYASSPDSFILHMVESSLLGDGYISKNGKYSEGHTKKHKEYVDYISNWLGECSCKRDTRISGKGSVMLRVISKTYDSLHELRKKWYPKGKKVVPQDLSWMDDFSVAKWYMDDGSLHRDKRSTTGHFPAFFATNGFERKDVERLANKLRDMYNVNCRVWYDCGWVLAINYNKGTIHNFWKAISPHMIPCMRYKLPQEYRDNYLWKANGHRGKEILKEENCPVIKIERPSLPKKVWPCRFNGFDLETTTNNYMCSGILVHNSFDSEHGAYANSLVMPNGFWETAEIYAKTGTLIFELISKQFQIVIDYKKKNYSEGLYLIGYRDHREDNKLVSYEDLKDIADDLGVPIFKTYQFGSLDQLIDTVKTLPVLEEGFVLRFENDLMVKVKGDAYLQMHRFISNLSDKNILEAVGNETIDSVLDICPEEYKDEVIEKVKYFKLKSWTLINQCYSYYKEAPKDSRKTLALWLNDNVPAHLRPFIFEIDNGKNIDSKRMYKLIRNLENVSGVTKI